MNEYVGGNRKLFLKDVGKRNMVKVESFRRIKDGTGMLVVREDEIRNILKDYFENLYNTDPQEQALMMFREETTLEESH